MPIETFDPEGRGHGTTWTALCATHYTPGVQRSNTWNAAASMFPSVAANAALASSSEAPMAINISTSGGTGAASWETR